MIGLEDAKQSPRCEIPVISAAEVERALSIEQLVPAMEEALVKYSARKIQQPLRSVLRREHPPAWFAAMPAIFDDVMGAKLVTVFPSNAGSGIHTHQALILLFSSSTGEPLAVLDGRVITAWRTAAVSALATRELAAPDAQVLAILGSGVQSRTHWTTLKRVRNFTEVRVWSRNREHAELFGRETGARVCERAEAAVRGADVVVSATSAIEPILQGRWIAERCHVNAVGAVGLTNRELDDQTLQQAFVVVESRESGMAESAEIVGSGVSIYAELGEILAGARPKPAGGRTVYKSLGIAVEDVAAARLIFYTLFPSPASRPL